MSSAANRGRITDQVRQVYRTIRLRPQKPTEANRISEEFNLSTTAAKVLAARGFKANQELKSFITPTLKDGLVPPEELKGLDKACELISDVISDAGAVAICCDFDVDGLSGGAQLYHFLKKLGIRTRVFVPDRFVDGYGLNENMVRSIAEQRFSLMITIDYGTTNIKELNLARELGLKTIVVDHHHVGEIRSPADVFINPQQEGCSFANKVLSASGLTWYLITALRAELKQAKMIDPKNYLDLACLGTICDMVPLIGVNRVIAKRGLELLTNTSRVGLQALKNVSGVRGDVSCTDISFGIGPRLNAAGRMVHGEVVIDLLTTEDSILAQKLANKLNRLNLERQETENKVKEIAVQEVQKRGEIPPGIVVWRDDFHTGVIGIVAQRLVENFYRPSAVMGQDTDGILKGSVRGIKGMSVVETLAAVSNHLIKFGGHTAAGGFSVAKQDVEEFAKAFSNECRKRLKGLDLEPVAEADAVVEIGEISRELISELKSFAPFGMGNPGPQLLLKDLKVAQVKELKGAHLKATLTDGKSYITGLLWRQTHHPALLPGSHVNIVCKPDMSSFNGQEEIQANLQAVERV